MICSNASGPRRIVAKWLRGVTAAFAAVTIAICVIGVQAAEAQNKRHPGIMQDLPGSFVTGNIVIRLNNGVTIDQVKPTLDANGLSVKRQMRMPGYFVVTLARDGVTPTDQGTLDVSGKLRDSGLFAYARPDYIHWAQDTTPNDPMYNVQWGFGVINAPKAWDLITATPNVVLCSLDTGVDVDHPDLKARIVAKRNFTVQPNDLDVHDTVGHGTHTTGTMGAITNNSTGVSGVTWDGPIFAGKVLGDSGSGSGSDVADGIVYVADNIKTASNNVVINLSLGHDSASDTPDPNDPAEAAVVYAAKVKNCIVTMAAGNDYQAGNPAHSPSRAAQLDVRLICVAACGKQKEHSAYSQARSYTTISAPGGNGSDDIISTLPVNQSSYGGPGWQGTSMATPHVSGVCALIMQSGADPSIVKQIITSTADTLGRAVPNPEYGFGVIDAYGAVVQAQSAISVVNPTEGGFVYGTTNIVIKAGDPSKYQGAKLQVDNSNTVVGQADGSTFTVPWNTQAVDPTTLAPLYPNGNHKVKLTVTTPSGDLVFIRNVKVDNPIAVIQSPAVNSYVTKTVSVGGTADGLRIPTYKLDYSLPSAPATWIPIQANTTAKVQGAQLGSWTLGTIPDGNATLRLTVKNPDGFAVSATSAVVVDQTPPTIPSSPTGVPSHKVATLNWVSSTDPAPGLLIGYNIYRSQKSLSGYDKITPTPIPTPGFTDNNLTNAFTYFYKITSVDAAGNESPPTDFLSVTPNRNGTASGQVSSTSGNFVGGATVEVLQSNVVVANGTTSTDTSGQYAFGAPPGFADGTYQLKVTKSGFVGQVLNGVAVALGVDALNRNFTLQPQPIFAASGWNTFTLPYDFQGQALSSVFNGTNVKYYVPSTGVYASPGDAAFAKPAPGVGYWINGGSGSLVTGSGIPNGTTVPVSIPIHPGWNLLGNPYQYPIRWGLNDLVLKRADNGQQATLNLAVNLGWGLDFAWGGTDGKTLIYDRGIVPSINDLIPAYGAFWFRSEIEGSLSIAPPPVINRSIKSQSGTWAVKLEARSGNSVSSAYVGVSQVHRAIPVPPAVSAGVNLVISGDTPSSAGFGVDLRAGGISQTWNLGLSNAADDAVVVTWPSIGDMPRGYSMYLTDTSTNHRVNLRNGSSFSITPGRAVRPLKLELVRDTPQRLGVSDFAVSGGGRGTSTQVRFNLMANAQVAVTVMSGSGDSLRTLMSRSASIGQNTVVWDGRDAQGRSVAPGAYLVQVKAVGDRGDVVKAVMPFVITR